MPTPIGIVFFCLAAYCFVFSEDSLFGLLIIASTFQAASAINVAERGIQPYYLVAVFIIARGFVNQSAGMRLSRVMPQQKWLALFGCIAVLSAFLFPFIFAGILVRSPKPDGDAIPPLSFGFNNVVQAAFLVCHIATAYALLTIRFSAEKARKFYMYAFYFVLFIVVAESLCQVTGIPFPHWLILNNPGYFIWDPEWETGGARNPGTFSEPSFAGCFFVMYYTGFLAEYLEGKSGLRNILLALVASALVTSGGSIFALCLVSLVLAVRYSPFRFPWYLNISGTKRLLRLGLLIAFPLLVAVVGFSAYRESLFSNTMDKTSSGSFLSRILADLYSLQLVVQTHGIGVGLGSNRASSLFTSMVSTVGVLGVCFFAGFCIKLLSGLANDNGWIRWAAFGVLLNMCINIPDVTTPTLWIVLMLAIQFTPDNKRAATRTKLQPVIATAQRL